MTHEEFEAVYHFAKDKLDQANARIQRKGGYICYDVWDNGNGTFDIRVRRRYIGNDDLIHHKYMYSVLVNVNIYSVYYCACGIEDATTINYL